MGRLRQTTPERKLRKREAQERWKEKNREYYLDQMRTLSNRPEYRELRARRYLEQKQECRRRYVAGVMGLEPQEVDFAHALVG